MFRYSEGQLIAPANAMGGRRAAIGDFITDLGYTARREAWLAMLGPMLDDRRSIVLPLGSSGRTEPGAAHATL